MNLIFSLCLTLLLVANCGGDHSQSPATTQHIHTYATEAGEFWVSVNGGAANKLLHGAQRFRPLVSRDGRWLAVEVRLMSGLEVVRLFRRDGVSFAPADPDVTTIAWRQVTTAKKISLEDLENTRAHVSGWGDDGNTLLLELSAFGPGEPGLIETIIAVPLDHAFRE